ncbi:cytochrome P450 [Streptomyces shenzhenensis]|uniref:Cytochrome P450 n=1 Tax=Streptomyces shenzhenensis TaxID=943815 RepID=A0A3M0IFF2_9ACTN|nr:cytochrome P450 [Streptomyces shenzhenensis]RMB87028.1 cytochrome P450 [Streptomyces shenzhenensis]
MTATAAADDTAGLPAYPGKRTGRCPFDPPTAYTGWRQGEGLQRVRTSHGKAAWVATRFDDAKVVLSDARFSADVRRFPQLTVSVQSAQGPQPFPRTDDPEHARIRRQFTGEFTVKRMEALRPAVRELIDGILDEMIGREERPVDLIQHFALPVPSLVISLLLGVPYEDHAFFQEHSAVLTRSFATREEKTAASGALNDYMLKLAHRKQREPGDDLVSRVLGVGELSPEEVAVNGKVLLLAGHETTANMIGLSVTALLENPEQAARIRNSDDPRLTAGAIDELLRYLSIPQDLIHRVATEDLTLGGQHVSAGDLVTVSLPAANRDDRFADADVLDLDRRLPPGGHLAFGHGIHQCLGQSLARVELQEALTLLLRRLPGLLLAVPMAEVKFRHEMAAFGVHELPVTW